MKRRRLIGLGTAIVTWVTLASVAVRAATVYIHPSSAWQISSWPYFKGMQEPPANWRERDFDYSGWSSGNAPFGYGLRGYVRCGTALNDMKTGYTAVFLRKHFQVDDLARTVALKLSVNYGDGFVAWLNGVEIAARNLALQRTVTVSSVEKDARFFRPAEAVDGTQLTFWSSEKKSENAPAWCAVDLGQSHSIDKVRLHWWGGELPGLGGSARDYAVEVSTDGQEWKTAPDDGGAAHTQ